LDVLGSVSANRFVISQQLDIVTLNVYVPAYAISVLNSHKVGIGTSAPKTALEIIGAVKVNQSLSSGLIGNNLNVFTMRRPTTTVIPGSKIWHF